MTSTHSYKHIPTPTRSIHTRPHTHIHTHVRANSRQTTANFTHLLMSSRNTRNPHPPTRQLPQNKHVMLSPRRAERNNIQRDMQNIYTTHTHTHTHTLSFTHIIYMHANSMHTHTLTHTQILYNSTPALCNC